MASTAQIELWHAEKVATQVTVLRRQTGFTMQRGARRASPTPTWSNWSAPCLRRCLPRLRKRAYYFVPLAIADTGDIMVAPAYTVELGDRAICHRNAVFGTTEAVFLSTRLVEDRFGMAFEFFINVAHNFVEAAGVPESFSRLVWSQAEAQVRGETSQDAWETRRRALGHCMAGQKGIDERARNSFYESAFSDALAVYMLVAGC